MSSVGLLYRVATRPHADATLVTKRIEHPRMQHPLGGYYPCESTQLVSDDIEIPGYMPGSQPHTLRLNPPKMNLRAWVQRERECVPPWR